MKILLRVLLSLLSLVVLAAAVIYIDGATFPVDHTASVVGTVAATPDKVFAIITDIAAGPTWRHSVKSVQVLPPDNGRDHWIETITHGDTMTFLAIRTDPPAKPASPSRREVLLDVPGAAYGGTWIYEISPGPTPSTTTLKITENGYIKPPIYRFVMHHIMGVTFNLKQYLSDIQEQATKV